MLRTWGGILLQTVHKLDVSCPVSKTGNARSREGSLPRDPGGLSFGTDRFDQQLYDLI